MRRRLLMGLDLGGAGARCLLADADARAGGAAGIWTAYRRSHIAESAGTAGGFDLEALWASLADAAREALARAKASPDEVAGVAATAMRFSLVVVDRDGAPLFAFPNSDASAVAEALALARDHGELLLERTGHWPHPVMAAARLLHVRAEAPDRFARAHRALAGSDWVALRLCGEAAAEPSQAVESLVFELAEPRWAPDLLERLGLARGLFPEVRPSGTRLGGLTQDAASALGLRAGTPVAVGGGDTQCGLLGAGATEPGALAAVAGTTTPVQLVLDAPRVAPDGRLWSGYHVVPGRFVLESNGGATGQALEWLARLLYPEALYPLTRLLVEAGSAPPGAGGMLSTVGAGVMNAREMTLPVAGLSFSPLLEGDRARVARAALEGMACGLRANAEQVARAAERTPHGLRLTGGLARSALFGSIAAGVLDAPVEVSAVTEASALGAAICAGVGAEVFADLEEGAARLARPGRVHEPDPDLAETYAALFESFERHREARAAADGVAAAALLRGVAGAARTAGAERPAPEIRPRILVTADLEETGLAALRALGSVEYASYREKMRLLTGDDLVKALEGFDVFITEVDVLDAGALARLPHLRVVASCRGDAVNVDIAACSAYGVPVLNAPGRNADAVADLTLAFLLMLARKLPEATAFLRQPGIEAGDMGRMGQAFGRLRGRELWHKTVGLVGLGAVGLRVARRLRAFDAHVLVHDPFVPAETVRAADAEPVDLAELLARSDFVSLHAPVTDQTRGLLDAQAIARMRPGACLVNTARAALVDEDALVGALESGHLGGAALDVFPVEPPGSDHPLLAMANVIATPHVGGNTFEVSAHQGRIVAGDLARLLRGERPEHVRNPETLERFRFEGPRPEPDAAALARLAEAPPAAVTDLDREAKRAQRGGARAQAEAGDREAAAPRRAESAAVRAAEETMQKLIGDFLERVGADERLRSAAEGKDVTIHFRLTDAGLDFHVRLRDGAVRAALGPPDAPAEVQLKMKAEVFDGMFTGRLNAMEAATSGRLSFSGDTAKAMTLQSINRDLARSYRAAVEKVGAPDLSAFAEEAPAAPAAPAAGGIAADDVRHELVRVVDELFAIQLITATGGNVSARIPAARSEFWITPSQLFKGDLAPGILVRIDAEGNALDEGARAPSSERWLHTEIYKRKPDANAVIHAHAPHATILANAGLPFLPISTEAAFFSEIPRVPFIMPGTREVAEACAEAMRESWAALLVNHGLVVAGRSLRRAADMVEIVERSCEVILGCYAVGKEPPALPEETVRTLRKMGDLVA